MRAAFRYLAVLTMSVAAVLAWVPQGTARPDLGTGIGDAWAHVCWGALVAILMALGWVGAGGRGALRILLVITALAGLLEVSQAFIGRGACVSDWGDGVAGAAVALGAWLVVARCWSGATAAGPS